MRKSSYSPALSRNVINFQRPLSEFFCIRKDTALAQQHEVSRTHNSYQLSMSSLAELQVLYLVTLGGAHSHTINFAHDLPVQCAATVGLYPIVMPRVLLMFTVHGQSSIFAGVFT